MSLDFLEIENPQAKGEILRDRRKYFHGIGYDLPRIKTILEKGILTQKDASKNGLDIFRNTEGFNLDDTVSVAESPSIKGTHKHGAFGLYIRNGISFIVDKQNLHIFEIPTSIRSDDPNVGRPSSGIIGEQFVEGSIPRVNVVGIMVPEEMLNRPLSELPLGLKNIGWGKIDSKCRSLVATVEKECGYSEDISLLEELIRRRGEIQQQSGLSSARDRQEEEIFLEMEKFVTKFMQKAYEKKLGRNGIRLKDVLAYYTPRNMQVYNTSGVPIRIAR